MAGGPAYVPQVAAMAVATGDVLGAVDPAAAVGVAAAVDDGVVVALPFEQQDSAVLSGLARATCLLVRAPHAPTAQAGDMVQVIPLPAVL